LFLPFAPVPIKNLTKLVVACLGIKLIEIPLVCKQFKSVNSSLIYFVFKASSQHYEQEQ